jgi:hypothetical protein
VGRSGMMMFKIKNLLLNYRLFVWRACSEKETKRVEKYIHAVSCFFLKWKHFWLGVIIIIFFDFDLLTELFTPVFNCLSFAFSLFVKYYRISLSFTIATKTQNNVLLEKIITVRFLFLNLKRKFDFCFNYKYIFDLLQFTSIVHHLVVSALLRF